MLIGSSQNPTPKVGQLIYKEYRSEDGEFLHASLCFVDQKPQEGQQWLYTQIAHREAEDGVMKGFGNFEAGGMPQIYTRIATDQDISDFIRLLKEASARGEPVMETSTNFADWLKAVADDEILLSEEKERINRLGTS